MNALSIESRRAAGTYNSLAHFAAAATSMTIYLLVILTVSWQLSLAAVAGTAVIAVLLFQIIKHSRKIGAVRSRATAKLYSELAEFLAEKCEIEAGLETKAVDLYRAYSTWADDLGMKAREVLSQTAFGRMAGEKFEKRRKKKCMRYFGLGLKP